MHVMYLADYVTYFVKLSAKLDDKQLLFQFHPPHLADKIGCRNIDLITRICREKILQLLSRG